MSALPNRRICLHCGRTYSLNPSVGRLRCPYCGSSPMDSYDAREKHNRKLKEAILRLHAKKLKPYEDTTQK